MRHLLVVFTLIVLNFSRQALAVPYRENEAAGPAKKQAIEQLVSSMEGLSEQKKAKLKIQLAIADFTIKYKRRPNNLAELVPEYFENIPLDPSSNRPFRYVKKENQYYVLAPDERIIEKEAAGAEPQSKTTP